MAVTALGQGVLLTRLQLRKARRASTDLKQQAAIDTALADPNFADDLTTEGLAAVSGIKEEAGGSILQQLLQWLIANLPQILAMILALFGGA